jgi:T4 RnlA family RNA ligase
VLNVQTYLREGGTLDYLKTVLGIKTSETEDLVLLSYSQIDSPKSNPMVMECRGLVLEKGTWNVVYLPFERFFNYGEMPALVEAFGPDFFKTAVALEKLDGSLLGLWSYKGVWHVSTRGSIDAGGQVGMCPLTFRQLFDATAEQYPDFWTAIDPLYTYSFELVSPENRVVTPYKARELYLLTVRRIITWEEFNRDEILTAALRMGVPVPAIYKFTDIEGLIELAKGQPKLNEGFVCVSYNHRYNGISWGRVKVKNPAYLAVAHLKDSSANSMRGLMMLVMQGETGEFLTYFPEFGPHIAKLDRVFTEFVAGLEADWLSLKELASKPITTENRKAFALEATKTRLPGMMFNLYLGRAKTIREAITQTVAQDGAKKAAQNMMKWCGCKDIEWAAAE